MWDSTEVIVKERAESRASEDLEYSSMLFSISSWRGSLDSSNLFRLVVASLMRSGPKEMSLILSLMSSKLCCVVTRDETFCSFSLLTIAAKDKLKESDLEISWTVVDPRPSKFLKLCCKKNDGKKKIAKKLISTDLFFSSFETWLLSSAFVLFKKTMMLIVITIIVYMKNDK